MHYESSAQALEKLRKLEKTYTAYVHAQGVIELDAATAAKNAADQARADAEQKLEAAEKAAKLANPDTAVLQVLSKRFLDEFNNMHNQLKQVLQTDPETGEKLKTAIIDTIDQMRGMIAGI